jgi:DNA-binding NarL/FixJ family response regulator
MKHAIQYYYADDHRLVRQGIVSMLATERVFAIGEANNGIELLLLLEKNTPDFVLLVLNMPLMNGSKALEVIKRKYPQVKVIILSVFDDGTLVRDMLQKGADAVLSKNSEFDTIIKSIKQVMIGGISPAHLVKPKVCFTRRELAIIPLLCAGKNSREIALDLTVSEKTVEANRTKLYEKVGAQNLTEFISYCTKRGLYLLGQDSDTRNFADFYERRNLQSVSQISFQHNSV